MICDCDSETSHHYNTTAADNEFDHAAAQSLITLTNTRCAVETFSFLTTLEPSVLLSRGFVYILLQKFSSLSSF